MLKDDPGNNSTFKLRKLKPRRRLQNLETLALGAIGWMASKPLNLNNSNQGIRNGTSY